MRNAPRSGGKLIVTFPTERTCKARDRAPEPDLVGARSWALLIAGSSQLPAAPTSPASTSTTRTGSSCSRPGPRPQHGDTSEVVVLPRAAHTTRCPVAALQSWLQLAGIIEGAVFPAVSEGNPALNRRLTSCRTAGS
jgi:hypothetical protein